MKSQALPASDQAAGMPKRSTNASSFPTSTDMTGVDELLGTDAFNALPRKDSVAGDPGVGVMGTEDYDAAEESSLEYLEMRRNDDEYNEDDNDLYETMPWKCRCYACKAQAAQVRA